MSRLYAKSVVFSRELVFEEPVSVESTTTRMFGDLNARSGDVFLHDSNLKFNTIDDTSLNTTSYVNGLKHVRDFNRQFTDTEYAVEQNDTTELERLGIANEVDEVAAVDVVCDYFEETKDMDTCRDKIWRMLRKQDVSPNGVCNCCCSPATNIANCLVILIRSGGKMPSKLQLKSGGEVIYNVDDSQDEDIVQISLQKTKHFSNANLLFFNRALTLGDTDNRTGLIKVMMKDEFEDNIVEFPVEMGVRSLKLIAS